MSETTEGLRRKISSAGDLQSVVRAMKALAASSIGQYEKSVLALADYFRAIELGLGACLRQGLPAGSYVETKAPAHKVAVRAIVFGSDQGLVGQFNEQVADFAVGTLKAWPAPVRVWAVGARVHSRLSDAGLRPRSPFTVPSSVTAITPLVGELLVETEPDDAWGEATELHIFYNHPTSSAAYEPVSQRVLPLDDVWRRKWIEHRWPTKTLPEVIGGTTSVLRGLIREYLFISLFRACAESLASENASRLAAMERANKNIDELLETLHSTFHRLRQSSIDEELFDVVSGFDALGGPRQEP